MVYFSSTAIRGASYDARIGLLRIQFTSGPQIYDYPNVPPNIWDGLLCAPSKGQYFNDYIRDSYSTSN